MKAAVVESYEKPPRYSSFADPVAAEGELEIQVTAAGLHPIVKALANGSHYGSTGALPFVPGVDGVGRLADGSRVYFGAVRSPFGTLAERAITTPGLSLPIPDSLDDVTVAASMNPGMSSWAALKLRAGFVSGQSVLILGATGIAGQLAIQIARHLGASRIVAVGRNPRALEKLTALGADAVLSLEQEHDALVQAFRREIAEVGIDVVLDYLWGHPAEVLLEAIAQKGLDHATARIRYVEVGESAGRTLSLPGATLRSSGLELIGSGFGSATVQQIMQAVGEFLAAFAAASFQVSSRALPLSEVEQSWNLPGDASRLVFQP